LDWVESLMDCAPDDLRANVRTTIL